jgi:hypothetical protein
MTLILNGTDNAVGNPAVQGGTGGATTGVYYPSANAIAIATGGVNALTISNTQVANFTNPITVGGNIAINGPAFSAYLSNAQTITNNTSTKMSLNTEVFDTNSNYDNTTNYRFTPTVAGYYQINGTVYFDSPNVYNAVFIFKNGSRYRTGVQAGNGAYSYGSTVSDIVFMNGTTDYIELYCYQQSGASRGLVTDAGTNFMSGCLVRGA